MAYLRAKKRGSNTYFYVCWRRQEQGRKQYFSKYAGTDSKAAHILLKEVEIDLLRDGERKLKVVPASQSTMLGELADNYLRYAQTNLDSFTFLNYRCHVQGVVSFLGRDVEIGRISLDALEQFKQSLLKRISPRSTRDYFTTLGAFFNWAIRFGYTEKNPVKNLKLPKLPVNPIPDHLTQQEVDVLITLAGQNKCAFFASRNTAILQTLVRTGLRASELCRLQWRDVDFERRLIMVHLGKGNKSRIIPLSDKLAEILRNYKQGSAVTVGPVFTERSGTPLTRNSLRLLFNRLERKFPGQRRLYCHLLRHTFASLLAQQGVSIYKIQKYMGHSDVRTTTKAYAALTPESLQDDINRLGL